MKIVAVSLFILLAVPGAALADDRQAARDAFKQGTRFYDIADFKQALEAFKRAYLHFEEPSLLYNIAQCYRQLGDKSEAVRFYRTFIRKAPPSQEVEDARQFVAALEAALAEEKRAKEAQFKTPNFEAPPPAPALAPSKPAPAPLLVEKKPEKNTDKKPVYKKWWFWTVTVVAAGAVATAIGVGVAESRPREPSFLVHAP